MKLVSVSVFFSVFTAGILFTGCASEKMMHADVVLPPVQKNCIAEETIPSAHQLNSTNAGLQPQGFTASVPVIPAHHPASPGILKSNLQQLTFGSKASIASVHKKLQFFDGIKAAKPAGQGVFWYVGFALIIIAAVIFVVGLFSLSVGTMLSAAGLGLIGILFIIFSSFV